MFTGRHPMPTFFYCPDRWRMLFDNIHIVCFTLSIGENAVSIASNNIRN